MRYRGTYNEARAAGQFAAGAPQEHLKNVELMNTASKESLQSNPVTPAPTAPTRLDSDVVSTPAANGSMLCDGWGQGLSPPGPTQLLFPEGSDGMDLGDKGTEKFNQGLEEEIPNQNGGDNSNENGGEVDPTQVAETADTKADEVEHPPPAPASAKAPPAPIPPNPKQKAPSKILYQNGSYWRTSSTQTHMYWLSVFQHLLRSGWNRIKRYVDSGKASSGVLDLFKQRGGSYMALIYIYI